MDRSRRPRGVPTGGQFATQRRDEAAVGLAVDPGFDLSGVPAVAFETIRFDRLYHVGELDPGGRKDVSFEGSGLSVSLHPDEWRTIARLGQAPTWTFDTSQAEFVDIHRLDSEATEAITDWAVDEGFLTTADGYEIVYFDDELGCEVSSVTDSVYEIEEALELEHEMAPVTVYKATTALVEAAGRDILNGDERSQAIILYFEHNHPEVAGIWWEDRFSPETLSAPRGVIFERSLDALVAARHPQLRA